MDSIKHISESVRIRNTGNPFSGDDVFVEVKRGDSWEVSYKTNSIGNDYAYTDANVAARQAIEDLAKAT